jgi:hypothetical protein
MHGEQQRLVAPPLLLQSLQLVLEPIDRGNSRRGRYGW